MTPVCAAWIGFAGSLVGSLLAGLFAIIVMRKTTKQTRDIQDENKHNAVQPVLVFCNNSIAMTKYMDSGGKGIVINQIENVGNGIAKDIKISVEYEGKSESLISITALKQEKETGCINVVSDGLHEMERLEKLNLIIEYLNIYSKSYKTAYDLSCDVNQYKIEKVTFK